jgi:hypothetical protein
VTAGAAGPQLWVVAGCLFEVSLPSSAGRWRPRDRNEGDGDGKNGDHVTLLAEHIEDDRQHFRFRAEAPGTVELHFQPDDGVRETTVHLLIAPERRD